MKNFVIVLGRNDREPMSNRRYLTTSGRWAKAGNARIRFYESSEDARMSAESAPLTRGFYISQLANPCECKGAHS